MEAELSPDSRRQAGQSCTTISSILDIYFCNHLCVTIHGLLARVQLLIHGLNVLYTSVSSARISRISGSVSPCLDAVTYARRWLMKVLPYFSSSSV